MAVSTEPPATSHSGRSARRKPADRRPGLHRPSLFADADGVEDIEPQRVRLLTTLESQQTRFRRPGRRGHRGVGPLPKGLGKAWVHRGLHAMLALGIVLILASFVQLLQHRPAPTPLVAPAAPLPMAAGHRAPPPPGHALAHTGATAAALIEEAPAAAGPAKAEGSNLPPSVPAMAHATPPSHSQRQPLHPNDATKSMDQALAHAAADVARLNAAPQRPAAAQAGVRAISSGAAPKEARARNHDDVALLEAMLTHAGSRRAPPSASEALARCGPGDAPEAAVCRARVCVQHPGTPACHGGTPP